MRSIFLKSFCPLVLSLILLAAVSVIDGLAQQKTVAVEANQSAEVGLTHAGNDEFAYSPRGRRDPFKPLVGEKVVAAKKIKGKSNRIKGPLEKFELGQYRLVALMVVKGVPRAMVKAPDGKSYTVKVGEYIGMNDGLVRKIETKVVEIDDSGMRVENSPDRIVVEEVGIDSYTGKLTKENRYIVM